VVSWPEGTDVATTPVIIATRRVPSLLCPGDPLYQGHNLPQQGEQFQRAPEPRRDRRRKDLYVIILGVILLLLGWFLDIGILTTIGIILIIIGAILWILGSMGRAVGGRRHYY
jgi:polyferredoxin